MNTFQDKVQLLNNLSYKFARTFTYNSNKVSDSFHFGGEVKFKQGLRIYIEVKWLLRLGKYHQYHAG